MLLEDGQAVEVGQAIVEDGQIDAGRRLLERDLAVFGLEHLVAGHGEPLGDRPANQLFVVNDQDGFVSHGQVVELRKLVASVANRP